MVKRSSRIKRWSGSTTVSIDPDVEVAIDYKGYEDPGICSGPVEDCYPPEGDEERTITGISIAGVALPEEIVEKLVTEIQELVDEQDLPHED